MGLDVIYTLPTVQDSRDFVTGKVNRLIANNDILQSMVKDRDTVDQKQVGNNIIYYRGTWTEKAAIMVTSDLNVYDEVDRSKQEVIAQYSSRLQHSKHKMEWFFSNPSVPGNGVSKHWDDSDQKHYFIKCKACGHRQFLDMDSIDRQKEIFVCKKCRKELNRRVGEWVRKYNDKSISGYWISLLMAPWVTAKEILKLEKEKSEQFFYNFVLGLPFVGDGSAVAPEDIFKNLTGFNLYPTDENNDRVVIGVDTGATIYYTVASDKGFFHYGSCKDYTEIENLLLRFKRSIAVFDQGGDLILPRQLREKYPGRVFLCSYAADRKTMQLIRWGKGEEAGNVIVDRNRMITLLLGEFRDGRIPLQGTESDWYDYYLHFKNIFKITEEGLYGPESKWERNGDDHWVHATVYARVGLSRFGKQGTIFGGVANDIQKGVEIVDNKIPLILPARNQSTDWRHT